MRELEKGLVSVIMPSFNSSRYISKAIESVLSQTYKHLELIVVDDCSSDNTEEIVKSFKDERLLFFKNTENKGAAVTRNFALEKAHGEWVAFLDSDDLWYSEKLEKQINFMKEKKYDFSYTAYREMNDFGEINGNTIYGPSHIGVSGMFNYCWPGCLTVIYNAEKVGLIQIADIRKNNDYALWLKIIRKADCYFFNEVLAQYRRREGSISNHYYHQLIKWHYKMFRESENCNCVLALLNTLRNLFFGLVKKLFYVKRGEILK